jgi:Tfp pilus assembly pilus retraction ATPase PilT
MIQHILLTGEPKAGKSYTLAKLIDSLRKEKAVKIKAIYLQFQYHLESCSIQK